MSTATLHPEIHIFTNNKEISEDIKQSLNDLSNFINNEIINHKVTFMDIIKAIGFMVIMTGIMIIAFFIAFIAMIIGVIEITFEWIGSLFKRTHYTN